MNKKIHLLALVLFIFANSNAQIKLATTVFSEDFNGAISTDWINIDVDGDGEEWYVIDYKSHPRLSGGGKMLASFSYDNNLGALIPNNYIFSPVMDLSAYNAGEVIKLRWKAAAINEDVYINNVFYNWSAEIFSVYVSNGNTVSSMEGSSTKMGPVSLSGINNLKNYELDITPFAGQSTVYFAFRHHSSEDKFGLVIDDVEIIAEKTLSSEKFFTENFNIYPNPVTDILNIQSKNGLNANEIKISDMTGKVVKVQKDATSVNVSNLSAGTYLIDITTNEGKATSKFIKK